MITPFVGGCVPEDGSVLTENIIRVEGNWFQYAESAYLPKVYQLPQNKQVVIAWNYEYGIIHPDHGSIGGSAPSTLRIWIKKLKTGVKCRMEFRDFKVEFTAGAEIRYHEPGENAKYPSWLRSLLAR